MLQLAPNGKLYASTWNGGLQALHVVNYPDLNGDSADFVYGGQPTLDATEPKKLPQWVELPAIKFHHNS